ncbi:dTDP-4-dehydrorhamnose reductase [Flavobacterium sp. AG291]|uniref:dTDP-4-dehydrorhamnose reductase n=1 Tax=Flavobacterium sp. AG291 TaxID=2184000 RepID=UPI000E0A3E29|nr:dTDP-4-dehydrorhamnose reductase [Flavobacterium sp. AG291]RDI12193.1 dTDP-4-dehydrorhamnose reductase [Flavobacterium sp. AG291]
MRNIIVTGGNGQLGNAINSIETEFGNGDNYIYLTAEQLDVTSVDSITEAVKVHKPFYIVNCAAYTAVDKAESEKDLAFSINAAAAENLAIICKNNSIKLIHISTDFVFGETNPLPLTEEMKAVPTSVYGATKLDGEKLIIQHLEEHFIIRTSWLYSEFQNNFLKTMIRLGNERDELSVVYDQVGTPTYAVDLAGFIMHIINSDSLAYGVYHYSNEGVASWYDFAYEIFKLNDIKINLKPITSDKFPTPAKRPNYSVMSKDKVKEVFGISINHWMESLANCIKKLN